MSDIKENTAAREAFSRFDDLVVQHFCTTVVFLGLTHLKKRKGESSGDDILGATVIRGRSDAKLFLYRTSEEDERRLFFSTVRTGRAVPKTFLEFDPVTGRSELGMSLEEDRKANVGRTELKTLDDILKFFVIHPDTTFKHDCLPAVVGSSDTKRRVFRKALADGILIQTGKGTKNSPFVYHVAPVRREEVA